MWGVSTSGFKYNILQVYYNRSGEEELHFSTCTERYFLCLCRNLKDFCLHLWFCFLPPIWVQAAVVAVSLVLSCFQSLPTQVRVALIGKLRAWPSSSALSSPQQTDIVSALLQKLPLSNLLLSWLVSTITRLELLNLGKQLLSNLEGAIHCFLAEKHICLSCSSSCKLSQCELKVSRVYEIDLMGT